VPKYRNLNLRTFVAAIDPLLVEEYFVNRVPQDQLIPYLRTTGMNYSYVKDLMAGLEDEQLKGKIGEELRQISDLGKKAMDILKHSEAFEHAWTLYCYYKSTTQVYEYCLPCKSVNTGTDNIQAFRTRIRDFFVKQAKGDQCVVKEFEEQNETALMIIHGSYYKTVARWIADEVVIDTFRPAYEDVVLYDKTRSVLKIKASRKDRDQYLNSFGKCILAIAEPEISEKNNVYTLRPLQNGTFSWDGNEKISSIAVLEVHLRMPGATEPVVIVRSADVNRSFKEDFSDLDFVSGEILYVKFRFTIETDGRTEPVVFVVNPPAVSDLTRMSHYNIISAYLKENGVLLV